MSRKAFLIWGLVIISCLPVFIAASQYLGVSRIIDLNKAAVVSAIVAFIVVPFLFGIILHLRFKLIGRRKRILALCIFLFLITLIMPGPAMLYNDHVVANSGAESRFFGAIREWSQTHDANTLVVWTQKQIIDYILITFPMHYIGQWSLFALLWFGSLDPRKPSKVAFMHFMKHGRFPAGSEKKTVMNSLISAVT